MRVSALLFGFALALTTLQANTATSADRPVLAPEAEPGAEG
jgi:hypothetical protein